MTHYTNSIENTFIQTKKLHMIEGICWMCLVENQLLARLKILQLTVRKSY